MRPDKGKPYYTAYEKRYRSAYEQGADYWGYVPEKEAQASEVKEFVSRYDLLGKTIAEFGCGEGGVGVELARLGCKYQGFDIAPSAIDKARTDLNTYPDANVFVWDIVNTHFNIECFDAGVDMSCLHMLVVDNDRKNYLSNAFASLKHSAYMLFCGESFRENAYRGDVNSYDQWLEITGVDVDTPQLRTAIKGDGEIQVMMPLIVARPRNEQDYISEMESVGFKVIEFTYSETWAKIIVYKP